MYIRSKKNKSGSKSIQIISKSSGSYKVIESIGVSYNEEEESTLKARGLRRIKELSRQQDLPLSSKSSETIISYLNSGINPKVTNVGPDLVLGKIFDNIGLKKIPDALFRHITLSRLIYPVSKLKTQEYLLLHHGIDVEISSIYRFLDKFHLKYKEEVESIVYEYSKKILGNVNIVFYDMTTLYFESEDEDDLRKIGFSKDGKFQNPQILMGLLVGTDGYPIGYDVFEGNLFEGHTLIPIIERLQKKYNLPKPVVVADSGLLSKSNINDLTKAGYTYILGARIKNEPEKLKENILSKSKNLGDGKAFRIKRAEDHDLIISYSLKRAKKDQYNRDKGIKKLRNNIASGKLQKKSINNRGYNKFLSIKNDIVVELNEKLIDQDKKWDGLKGYITNSDLPKNKVIEAYKELWKIEKAFRISKTDLRIRPIYLRKHNRIKAHICIAFAAYAIYKELERIIILNNIPISPVKAIELTKAIYNIEFIIPETNQVINIFNNLTDMQKNILNLLH